MNETTITDARNNQQNEPGRRESGTPGGLAEADGTDAEWMESEWFGDWLKLAHNHESSK